MSDVTLSFGAIDQGAAQAARKLAGDLSRTEAAAAKVNKSFSAMGSTGAVGVLKAFGAFQLGKNLVNLASSAMDEYAKKSDAGAAAQERVNKAVSNFKANLGSDLASLTDGYDTLIRKADEFRMGLVDELAGVINPGNPQGMARAATQDEMRQTRAKQSKAIAEAMLEDTYAGWWKAQPGGMNEDAAQNMERVRNRKAVERINEMRRTGVFDTLAPGEEDKLRKDEGMRHEAEWEKLHREYAERKDMTRFTLESTMKEAEIGTLRAQGRDKEARAEQVVLDTARKILEVKRNELLTVDERIKATMAIAAAGEAELGLSAPGLKPRKYNGSIGGGLNSASLGKMVFGKTIGMGSSQQDPTKQLEQIKKNAIDQVNLLKVIEMNTRGGSGASFN